VAWAHRVFNVAVALPFLRCPRPFERLLARLWPLSSGCPKRRAPPEEPAARGGGGAAMRRASAVLVEAERADVEEADHEEHHERDAHPGAEVHGEPDRRGEVQAEEDLEERVDRERGAVALLLPQGLLFVADDAVLRRAHELHVVAEEA